MFPLGNVVMPTQLLPLHIFEDRYRDLMEALTDHGSTGEVGFVLIERGSEVGGGEKRVDTGTVAHLIEAERLDDGRWVAIFAGSHPLRVERWLEDDPFPRAMVDERPDDPWDPAHAPLLAGAETAVREALGLAAELGEPVGNPGFALPPDPVLASWELCARAPLGAFDRQRLLETGSRPARLELLTRLSADAVRILAFRLHGR